jgi:hypothetical protein
LSDENPIVTAKKRLTAALDRETESMKGNYEKLKQADQVKLKKFFAHELQLFCGFVDQTKDVIEAYFNHNSVPVGLIRSMEDYYATLKVLLSEFPDVAMDPKLQGAVSKAFLPYQQVLSKMSKVADDYVAQKKAGNI